MPAPTTIEELMREAVGLAQSGRMADAAAVARRALEAEPAHAGANGLMGTLLHAMGRGGEAVAYLERAHVGAPNDARLAYQLGAVLCTSGAPGAWSRGVGFMRRAVELDPAWVQGMNGLASVLYGAGDFEGAEAAYRRSLAVEAGQAAALCGLGGLLIVSGRPAGAVSLFREAGRRHPENAEVMGKLLSALNYAEDATPEETFAAHAAWGRLIGTADRREFANRRESERKIRVGMLSPDLYDHSCAYFLRPILRNRERGAFDVVCYSTSGKADWMTEQIRGLADGWRDVAGVTGEKIVQMIRGDGVDVLLELSGHTALGPLAALRDRAAPVQATYLGYPNTTGLTTMDWRMVDGVTDVPGAEAWHTEKLWRLKGCFLCYSAPEHAPAVGPAPCLTAPGVTFGSFNSIRKLSPGVVRVWSRVLKEVEGSRLLVKTRGLEHPWVRRNVLTQFGAQGVGPERVELTGMVASKADHLAWYHRVDIGLDTFPYNGTTTTCEALWMGVPVVSPAGRVHAGRVGASLLAAAGLPELVGRTEDEFVAIAVTLARDPARLGAMRVGMRERLGRSALTDGAGHAREFFGAVRGMWRGWCTGGGA